MCDSRASEEKYYRKGVSVIICCHNSSWIISRCLESLKRQNIPEGLAWEVIIVDNKCEDDTVRLAQEAMQGSPVRFHVVSESTPGLLNARKRGISAVRYDKVIFSDDDNLLCPNYVATMARILDENPIIGAVGGKGVEEFESQPDPKIMPLIQGYAVGSQKTNVENNYLFGAGLALRTSLVREIYSSQTCYLTGRKGDMLLAGDDSELVRSILLRGYKIHAIDEIEYIHVLASQRLTLEYYHKMEEGFVLSSPVLMTMNAVIEGAGFKFIIREYRLLLKRIMKAKIQRARCSRHDYLLYKAFKLWGMRTLLTIYLDCNNIQKSHRIS